MNSLSKRITGLQDRISLKQTVGKASGQAKAGPAKTDPLDMQALEEWSTSTKASPDKVVYLHKGALGGNLVSTRKQSRVTWLTSRFRRSPEQAKDVFRLRAHAGFAQRISALGNDVQRWKLTEMLSHFINSKEITLRDLREMQQVLRQAEAKEQPAGTGVTRGLPDSISVEGGAAAEAGTHGVLGDPMTEAKATPSLHDQLDARLESFVELEKSAKGDAQRYKESLVHRPGYDLVKRRQERMALDGMFAPAGSTNELTYLLEMTAHEIQRDKPEALRKLKSLLLDTPYLGMCHIGSAEAMIATCTRWSDEVEAQSLGKPADPTPRNDASREPGEGLPRGR